MLFSDLDRDADAAALMCGVLSSICKDETVAQQADEKGLISKVLTLIDENCSKPEFGVGALEFVSALSNFESLQETLIANSAFEVLSSAVAYHQESNPYQVRLSRRMQDRVSSAGSFRGYVQSVRIRDRRFGYRRKGRL